MKKIFTPASVILLIILLGVAFNASSLYAQTAGLSSTKEQEIPTPPNLLRFEANVGQFNEQVLFRANDAQATHFFMDGEIRTTIKGAEKTEGYAYGMTFLGANEDASFRAIGGGRNQASRKNYITSQGNFGDVPLHRRLHYQNLWDGINTQFFESDGQMKYDFKVAPGADPSQVRFLMKGAENLRVNDKGELEFDSPLGTMTKGVPFTYQMVNKQRVKVEAAYQISGDTISFELGEYNPDLLLTIDPIALKYSAYLQGADWDPYHSYYDPASDLLYITGGGDAGDEGLIGTVPEIGPINIDNGYDNVIVMAMEPDGSAVVWTTIIGGSSPTSTAASQNIGQGIYKAPGGDVFVRGTTRATDFPVNGAVAAFDDTANGSTDQFIVRLSADGSTLLYGTYFGGDQNNDGDYFSRGLVVQGDVVYGSGAVRIEEYPQLPAPTYISNSSAAAVGDEATGIFAINTAVGGAAGLEGFALYGNNSFGAYDIDSDAAGNIYIIGNDYYPGGGDIALADSDLTPDAVQTYASIEAAVGGDPFFSDQGAYIAFVAKFDAGLSNLLYASAVLTVFGEDYYMYGQEGHRMEVNDAGDMFIMTDMAFSGANGTFPTLLYGPTTGPIRDLSNTDFTADNYSIVKTITKLPASNPSAFSFITIIPGDDNYDYANEIDYDSKGRIHVLNHQYTGSSSANFASYASKVSTTPGAVFTDADLTDQGSYDATPTYSVFGPTGSMEYNTLLPVNGEAYGAGHSMTLDREECTAYIFTVNRDFNSAPLLTPSYYDQDAGAQVNVINSSPRVPDGNSAHIIVFHEPEPNNNTITDFAAGENDFCVGSLIYQNPNDGPIQGEEITYTSGDGSSSEHNLPLLFQNGVASDHPTPNSPKIVYQWQLSRDGGAIWENIVGGNLIVLKPDSEAIAGMVEYRRAAITGCCDTIFSNIATATIAGDLDLLIDAPTDPVYYCQGTATDLGITISGATGNISWQWYNGFSPITDAEINPASGSGVPEGSFTAEIPTSQTTNGFYRLVVTDAGGCKRESFVTIASLTDAAFTGPNAPICPGSGGDFVILGPNAPNPAFDYMWSGPSSFMSTEANPQVTEAGVYTLQVSLTGQNMFCAAGETTVTVTPLEAHDAALIPLTDMTFCQSDDPAPIGLSGTPPSGYVFQWSPGINLNNNQAYSPVFDPGSLPLGLNPVAVLDYTFTALRDDGCIYEDVVQITDIELALANAGPDGVACDSRVVGRSSTTGDYFQWEALETTYAAGLATLVGDPGFNIDGVNANMGSSKFATVQAPIDAMSDCYDVTYVLRSSFVPFPNTCFSTDTVTVVYCCTGDIGCPTPSSNMMGTGGTCGGENTILSINPIDGLSAEWTTYSVDGVVQAANTPPQGLFTVVDDAQGVAIAPTGPHPDAVVANFDDPTWGWAGANFVVYEVRFFGEIAGQQFDCTERVQVFSSQNSVPVIGVVDPTLCAFPEGAELGMSPNSSPYTVSGSDFTQAPNSGLNWLWTNLNGSASTTITANANSPFPTLEPDVDISYLVRATDPITGCVAFDTMMVDIVDVIADAGADNTALCQGSLVQLGTAAQPNHTYVWDPATGLNFPLAPPTPNNTTAQPFLLMPDAPGGITYTVTVTETTTGCQAVDDVTFTTTADPPVQPSTETNTLCTAEDVSFTYTLTGSALLGHTYAWSTLGAGSIGWFDDPSIYEPTVTVPMGTAPGTYTFRLTVTKGACGSVTQDFDIIVNPLPDVDLGSDVDPSCTAPLTELSVTPTAGFRYQWTPAAGLFTDDAGTIPYDGGNASANATLYVGASGSDVTYTITATPTSSAVRGCTTSGMIVVNAATPDPVVAGDDAVYCPDGDPLTLGVANSGTPHLWEAVGYNADPDGVPAAPGGQTATMEAYLGSTTANVTTFSQSPAAGGVYVYSLTSTFANGCSVSDEITITVPNLPSGFAGAPTSVCEGLSVQLGASFPGLSYSWTALNPATESYTIDDPTLAAPTVSPVVTTTYQVVATDFATGCEVTETVLVTVTPKPVIDDVTLLVACAPIAAVDLTAQIPGYATYFNHVWYTNSVPGTIVVDPTAVMPSRTTSYFLVAENEFGCPDQAEVLVQVENPQTPILPLSVTPDCGTQLFDLSTLTPPTPSVPGGIFEWHSTNDTDPGSLITDLEVGPATYYLFETTANGCESPGAPLVVNTPVCFDLALTKMLAPGQSPTVIPGEDVTFIITIYNQGNVAANNIVIEDYPPTGMMLNDGDWNLDNTITLSAPMNLPAGGLTMANGPATIEVTYTVDVGVAATITLVNQAEITSALNVVTGITQTGDADSFYDNDATNNPGGLVDSPADNEIMGNGTGMLGDNDPVGDADNADPASLTVCVNVVTVAEPATICSTQRIDLTAGASITPNTLGGTWSTLNGDLSGFDNGTTFGMATTYTPSPEDAARSSVTLILTTDDPAGTCGAVSAMVTFTILKVDCGSYPWDGND
jgi:uncharacterized repeat protein (TIGR01451 family)